MYTHTHTHTHIPIFLVLFSKKAKIQLILSQRFRDTGICFITDFLSDSTNELLGIGVVWGNAEEKVQIVNALVKVRYGGGQC